MKDLRAKLEKLQTEAEDCELIAGWPPIPTSATFLKN